MLTAFGLLSARGLSRGLSLLGLGALAAGCLGQSPPPPAAAQPLAPARSDATPPPPEGPERADVPSPRRVEHSWMSLEEWRRRHERQLAHPGRETARLVVLGDSIVEAWCQSAAFERAFDGYHPLGLGIGGDQTQHLLWRIDAGALDGLSPEVVVLLIGVNNLGNGFSPEQTRTGVAAVVERVRARLPRAKLLLLAILPAGREPDDGLRQAVQATNPALAELAVPGHVRFADVGGVLLEADGRIEPSVMADFLHPTASGYERLTQAVKPLVESLAR